jgi:hypothetical protein
VGANVVAGLKLAVVHFYVPAGPSHTLRSKGLGLSYNQANTDMQLISMAAFGSR